MVSYKLDKYDKYFVAFILFILVIFNIGQCFAVEEETVDLNVVNNLAASFERNYFTYFENIGSYYCELEKGYIYTIHNDNNSGQLSYVFCNETPAANVPYYDLDSVQAQSTYSFIVDNNFNYLILSGNNLTGNRYVTRRKIASQENAVNDLVSNVGPQQLWSVFESGIDFIGVVVLVAFGLFLIVLLIKKLSKGKSDF